MCASWIWWCADSAIRMMLPELTDFAQRYAKAWCSQNPDSVAAFFAESGSLSVNDAPPAIGRAAIAEIARGFMGDFPDMVVTMDNLSRDSDGTKFHWTLTGTNTGPGGTGKRVCISGYELWKIDNGAGGSRATWTGKPERVDEEGGESINNGLIAESKGHFDSAEYERQLQHGVAAGRGD
jgi:SnoaL-like polyketide cyclase